MVIKFFLNCNVYEISPCSSALAMTDRPFHLLVAGASGVIGTAATEHFARLPEWRVTALSRRRPAVSDDIPFHHAAIDLLDAAACATLVDDAAPVTHLVYAAVSEAPGLASGWRDPQLIGENGAMFANLLAPLARTGTLRHVSLLQGAKAYGAHVHPVAVPLREARAVIERAVSRGVAGDGLRSLAREFEPLARCRQR